MSPFHPLIDQQNIDIDLINALSRISPIIARLTDFDSLPEISPKYLLIDHEIGSSDKEHVLSHLDSGEAEKAIVPVSLLQQIRDVVPPSRLIVLLDAANISAISDSIRKAVSGVFLQTIEGDGTDLSHVSAIFPDSSVFVLPTIDEGRYPSLSTVKKLNDTGASPIIPISKLSLADTSPQQLNIADAFVASIRSDRTDGLFPTVVSSFAQMNRSLGLVYSSPASIKESIITGKGVYHSRKHGLWRKGETSGATQDVVSIRLDCDSDALEFVVVQNGSGFCHTNRMSCFNPGHLTGLSALESTLSSRLVDAPEGSYTRRLFHDESLLKAKIMEEAEELCTAKTKKEVIYEAADLLYFALVRCVKEGVCLSDIEKELDRKAKKITRRAGNAKPQWSSRVQAQVEELKPSDGGQSAQPSSSAAPPFTPPVAVSVPVWPSGSIHMLTYDLSTLSPTQSAQLLKRPVLNSSEMISKVKPIVDEVRARGDAALVEFTAKFDGVRLVPPTSSSASSSSSASDSSLVLYPPFYGPNSPTPPLPTETVNAIDHAYRNITAFHAAQLSSPLSIETMPGVTCTRFSRAISRVGLYIPGGSAVLPSTALMLGIPAQVAGCPSITLATPPRADGSVAPEVMYVAQLVGATSIVKAGGAQAVAALAYGTESVQKVDKIFGPGNQWVTAAKMLVQNDTDALVGIDMPAGPSEVLVIADETCNPAFVAADLLSQAEHGPDSQVVLVATSLSPSLLAAIESEVDSQARALPRVDILRQSVSKSIIVKVESVEEALKFSNNYAPEHLIMHVEDAHRWVDKVQNAGSVFVGAYSPESCGDYASGTNHTLPTNGYARQFSGVNTQSFQKHITSQEVTPEGLKVLGPIVVTLAECEGLQAHANAVLVRLAAQKS